jgi:TM2 domain-containing membrane protein YozV
MLCQKCGYRLSVTAKFCPSCGTTVEDTSYSPSLPISNPPSTQNPSASLMPPPLAFPPSPTPSGSLPLTMMGSDTYFLLLNGQQSGPYTINQMKAMWQNGNINVGTNYWQAGMAGWQSLANIRHFMDAPVANNPGNQIVINQVNQQPAYHPAMMLSSKSRGTFIVLGLFFGCFGVHNFYAGYSGKGVAQLLISVFLGLFFGFGFFITWIWMLIEIIAVNTDAQGLRMS